MPVLQTAPTATTSGQGVPRAECRVRERRPCDLEASCQPVAARLDNDLHWPGTIRDISTGGAGLILGRRFEPGAGLAVELPASGDRSEETLLARVRHATRLPDGRWLHGCAFISELSDDELERLLRATRGWLAPPPVVAAPPAEASVVANVTFQGLASDGKAVRFTARRAHPAIEWPLAPGTALALRVGGDGEDPGHVRIVAERCWEQDDAWTVRCRFVDQPRAEVLRLLGHPAFRA